MGTIAEFMHCDASNVTSMVDKLETRALLRRQPSPEDRRVKLIALTDEGLTFRKSLIEHVCQPQEWILALDEQDQLELARIFRKARERLRAAGE
jgi:DNA-binding MarR family transcriptional regulator